MNFEKLYNNAFIQFVVIAFIAAIFISPPEALLQDDLDSAVRWASNHLFKFGSENFYLYPHTNGPLFFLKFPIPGNKSILLSVLFDFFTKVILGYYLIQLSNLYRPKNYWLPLAIFILFCSLFYLDFIIIGIALATCLIALHSQKILPLIPGLAVIAVSIFIKASISFPALFIFGSTILILLLRKQFAYSIKLVGIFLAGFLLLTLILYGNLFKSLSWIISAFIATLSYGDDQAIFFNNTVLLVLLTAISVLIIPLIIRNKQTQNFMFISALAIFSIWKYSLGREDFTHYRAWYYLCILLGCFIVLINNKKYAIIGFVCFVLSLTFFVTNTKMGDSPKEITFKLPQLEYFPRAILRTKNVNEEVQNNSWNAMSGSNLTDSMLQEMGNKSVDVFPWGLAILYKYNLNYKPRPSFHSTILGTETDKDEADYFGSGNAPDYVLWHESQPSLYSLNAHDQIYLPNAVPNGFKSLLQHYSLQQYENGYALWQKTKAKKLIANGETTLNIKMNEWFTLPTMDSNVIAFAHTNLKLSALEKVIAFLYKGPFFKMAYKLENGEEAWHFVSLTSLQNAFLAQPYFINPAMESKCVTQIFIEPMDKKFQHKELEITFSKEILQLTN